MKNIILNTDSYKTSHFLQYPPKSEFVSSYIEARNDDDKSCIFFGLQAFIKEYLLTPFTQKDLDEANDIITAHGLIFNYNDWKYILDKYDGYLPLEISAVKEGSKIPLKCPLVQVINTDKKLPWLTSYIETALLRAIWYPSTVATISYEVKQIIKEFLDKTSNDTNSELEFKLHDFGARGVSSNESSILGGMAHLLNFKGTDTLSCIVGAKRYYNAEMAGFSIPASEHSTITSWQKNGEEEAYSNMIDKFAKKGSMFAVVSDSYDIYNAISNIWGKNLKEKVLNSGATLIVRPDSGNPKEMVLEVIQRLYKSFGGYINTKGYIVLNDAIRVIQGDGVDKHSIKEILRTLEKEGFSASNIAFGMGGALLQQPNRDTLSFAMKASAIKVDGVWKDVYKDPITDSKKRSKKGRLALLEDFTTIKLDELNNRINLLEIVYTNGILVREQNFDDIREKINER